MQCKSTGGHVGRGGRAEGSIRRALLDLMRTHPLHEVRVTELCREAGVNRSTFYAHYCDVYDVVDQMEQDVLASLDKTIASISPESNSSEEICLRFMRFFDEGRQDLGVLLRSERGRHLTELMEGSIMDYYVGLVERRSGHEPSSQTVEALQFSAAGFWQLYQRIALSDGGLDLDRLAGMAASVSSYGIDRYLVELRGEGV